MHFVRDVQYVSAYKLRLRFEDGAEREVDLSQHLDGEVFEPLKDLNFFSQVKFDPEMDTIVWPNGADLAPEYLKELVVQQSVATAKAS